MPAVSMRVKGTPAMFTPSSMLSRVVPGASVTIARSSLSSALNRDDLPTFGFPTRMVVTPSRKMRPWVYEEMCLSKRVRTADSSWTVSRVSGRVRSSSGKSRDASSTAVAFTRESSALLISRDTPPSSCCTAERRLACVRACTTSQTASA